MGGRPTYASSMTDNDYMELYDATTGQTKRLAYSVFAPYFAEAAFSPEVAGTVEASKFVLVSGAKSASKFGTIAASIVNGDSVNAITVVSTTVTASSATVVGMNAVTVIATTATASLVTVYGTKITNNLTIETGTTDCAFTSTGTLVLLTGLPTADPTVAGALYVSGGALLVSAGA